MSIFYKHDNMKVNRTHYVVCAGCENMYCTNCHAHICWLCLKTFKEDREVYDHLDLKHPLEERGLDEPEWHPNMDDDDDDDDEDFV